VRSPSPFSGCRFFPPSVPLPCSSFPSPDLFVTLSNQPPQRRVSHVPPSIFTWLQPFRSSPPSWLGCTFRFFHCFFLVPSTLRLTRMPLFPFHEEDQFFTVPPLAHANLVLDHPVPSLSCSGSVPPNPYFNDSGLIPSFPFIFRKSRCRSSPPFAILVGKDGPTYFFEWKDMLLRVFLSP